MLGLFLTVLLMSSPDLTLSSFEDSSLLPGIRVRPYGEAASPVSVKGHLGEQPLAIYIDPPGGLATWVSSQMETSLDGVNFSTQTAHSTESGKKSFSPGMLSDVTTCYRMRWKDAEGMEHISGVFLARRFHDGVVDALYAAPFTAGESIGLELALRQRAYLRVVVTEISTGRPQLLFRGMAEQGVDRWELGAGLELRPGIWEMAVYVNGTERMRFEIEI